MSAASSTFIICELPGPGYFPSGAKEKHYAAIGNAIHAYLAALPSMDALDDAHKGAVAQRCLSSFAVSGLVDPADLVSAGNRFSSWLSAEFSGARWLAEVRATVTRADGGHWNGAIDLLLELPDGRIVIVDHKSAPLRREHCAMKAATFSGQLVAYREMMSRAGYTVASCWIHFPLAGVVARQE